MEQGIKKKGKQSISSGILKLAAKLQEGIETLRMLQALLCFPLIRGICPVVKAMQMPYILLGRKENSLSMIEKWGFYFTMEQ